MGGILWYLWALIGIYLIIPFVNHNIYSNIKIQNIYLILWVIAALGLVIRVFNPEIWGETHWINSYNTLYYFSGYFGYLLLGTRIHNYGKDIKYHYLVIGLIVSLLLTYCVRQELFGISWGNQRVWFVFPTSILISYFTFKLFSIANFNTNSSVYRLVKIVSKHSFGIYLSHMLFYRLFMRQLIYQYSTAWYTQIATIIIVFFISLFFCMTISKLPFHKYIM